MMDDPNADAHIRQVSTILLISTTLSFAPLHHRIRSYGDTSGISLWYLALHAFAWMEQFAMIAHMFVTVPAGDMHVPDTVMHVPPSTGDWLNLAQLGALWGCSLIILLQSLRYTPSAPFTKTLILLLYLSWFAISIAAVAVEEYTSHEGTTLLTPPQRRRLLALFADWHTGVLNPAASAAIPLSFIAQVCETLRFRHRGSLSVWTLASQAVSFSALSSSWQERMYIPERDLPKNPHESLAVWYNNGGWAVADSGLYAMVQGLVLLLALFAWCLPPPPRHRRKIKVKAKPKPKPKPKPKKKAKAKSKSGRRWYWPFKRRASKHPTERSPLLATFSHPGSPSRSRGASPETSPLLSGLLTPPGSPRSMRSSNKGKSPDRSPLLPQFEIRSRPGSPDSVKSKKSKGKGKSPDTSPLLPQLGFLSRPGSPSK